MHRSKVPSAHSIRSRHAAEDAEKRAVQEVSVQKVNNTHAQEGQRGGSYKKQRPTQVRNIESFYFNYQ